MTLPAWRPALVAALACFLAAYPLQATQGDPQPADSASTPSPQATATTAPKAAPPVDVDSLGRTLTYLTLLAAAAFLAYHFLKNGNPFRNRTAASARKLQVLETRPLGNRQFLLVVAYEDTRILLGVTPGKIDYLCPLDQGTSRDFADLVSQDKPTTAP